MQAKKNDICILCIGILVLSLEIHIVKLIQAIEKISGSFYENIWYYFKEPIIFIPIIATIIVIIYKSV